MSEGVRDDPSGAHWREGPGTRTSRMSAVGEEPGTKSPCHGGTVSMSKGKGMKGRRTAKREVLTTGMFRGMKKGRGAREGAECLKIRCATK